jgi:acyl-CoA thioesterase
VTNEAIKADDLARQVADAMWAKDLASQALGLQLQQVGQGHARFSMTVRPEHCNGFGVLHGGVLATLADTAFAFACNSSNALTLATGFDIDILRSAQVGDALSARAECRHQGGQNGLYDVTITRGEDTIAHFRGRSQRLKGRKVVEEI